MNLQEPVDTMDPKPIAQDPLVRFGAIGLNYGQKTILDRIDMDVGENEFLCIVGASGCGKTTLLRIVAGLVSPSRGEISYAGRPVTAPTRDVAMVFQDYTNALLPWRSSAGNVELALEGRGISKAAREARIKELLSLVGLSGHEDKLPGELSGGMQQRLQIARCLAQDPKMLLMDEPFGALDALTRRSLQDEIRRIAQAEGLTVMFVTHDLEEAIYLGDRVVALKSHPGRIASVYDIDLPRERNQIETPDLPEFRRLRHELFSFFEGAH